MRRMRKRDIIFIKPTLEFAAMLARSNRGQESGEGRADGPRIEKIRN